MTPELMGPPGVSEMDTRMSALRTNLAGSGRTAGVGVNKGDILKAILPLLIAQGLDLVSTEQAIGTPTPKPYIYNGKLWTHHPIYERNPLPGMQSSVGRIGWGALEAALAALVLKKAPKVGVPARNALVGVHTGLARGNQDSTDRRRRQSGDSALVWGK